MFSRASFVHRVKLRATDVGSNLREVIDERVRTQLEGVCCEHGYVRPNSLRVMDVSEGRLSRIDMARHYTFDVSVSAEVCNPVPGLRFNALIRSVNRFGALAEGGYYDPDGTLVPVVEIVVVRNPATLQNEVDIDAVRVGDEIGVEVLGRQFDLRESRISAYGRTVKSVVSSAESSRPEFADDGSGSDDDVDFGGGGVGGDEFGDDEADESDKEDKEDGEGEGGDRDEADESGKEDGEADESDKENGEEDDGDGDVGDDGASIAGSLSDVSLDDDAALWAL
jgi:DNA-directed RNA polymerase subunit E'/Rpb7